MPRIRVLTPAGLHHGPAEFHIWKSDQEADFPDNPLYVKWLKNQEERGNIQILSSPSEEEKESEIREEDSEGIKLVENKDGSEREEEVESEEDEETEKSGNEEAEPEEETSDEEVEPEEGEEDNSIESLVRKSATSSGKKDKKNKRGR